MENSNPGRDRVIRVTIASGVLATVAVCLRFAARWRSKASFAADDWCMVASLIPSYAMLAVGSIMITSGKGGQHSNTLTEGQMATFLKTLDAALITYTLTIAMVKISILLLYRRIFDTRNFRRASLIVGGACITWLVVALLCLAFQCRTEADRYHTDTLFSGQCIDMKAYWAAITGSNMALDIIILCMALYMVWNLKLAIRQKMALSGIFALGALVCVASVMRIITIDLVRGGDITYTAMTCYLWSQIEPTMAIVCACLTTLRPLFIGLNFSFLSSISWTSRYSTSSSSARSKRRRSDITDDLGKEQQKKMKLPGSAFGHRNSLLKKLGFERMDSAGSQEGVMSLESVKTQSILLEDGMASPLGKEPDVSIV